MPSYDRTLTDPSAAEVTRTLLKAQSAANRRLQMGRLERERDFWERQARSSVLRRREGFRIWQTQGGYSARVRLAWWKDYLGRKLVRITGDQPDWYGQISAKEARRRPPLWNLAPDRVFAVQRGSATEYRVACACGVAGTPEQLAWMGDCCGPCFDRRTESGEDSAAGLEWLSHKRGVWSLDFLPDGRLVSVGWDNTARLWVRSSEPCRELKGNRYGGWLCSIASSPDGRTVALGERYGGVWLWDAETGETRSFKLSNYYLSGLAFTPDAQRLIACGTDIRLVELSGKEEPTVRVLAEFGALAMALDSQGRRLYTVDASATVRTLEWASGEVTTLRDGRAPITWEHGDGGYDCKLALSADGKWLAVSDEDHQIRIRSTDKKSRETVLPAVSNSTGGFAFTSDSRHLVRATADGFLTIYGVGRWREVGRLGFSPSTVYALAVSPDGGTVATGHAHGGIKLWPWKALLGEDGDGV